MSLAPGEVVQRGKELKEVRKRGFEIWEKNLLILAKELRAQLQEQGYQVPYPTCQTWLSRWRKGKGSARKREVREGKAMSLALREIVRRGKELEEPRKLAFFLWKENPLISAKEIISQLQEQGYQIPYGTCQAWLNRWRKGKGYARKREVKAEPGKEVAISFEEIVKAAPNVETLSLLFFQGAMKVMTEKDAAHDVTKQENIGQQQLISNLKQELEQTARDKNKITRLYNELLVKKKVGTLELDKVHHALVPKY